MASRLPSLFQLLLFCCFDRSLCRSINRTTCFFRFALASLLASPLLCLLVVVRAGTTNERSLLCFLTKEGTVGVTATPLSQLLLFCCFDRSLRRPIEQLAFASFPCSGFRLTDSLPKEEKVRFAATPHLAIICFQFSLLALSLFAGFPCQRCLFFDFALLLFESKG